MNEMLSSNLLFVARCDFIFCLKDVVVACFMCCGSPLYYLPPRCSRLPWLLVNQYISSITWRLLLERAFTLCMSCTQMNMLLMPPHRLGLGCLLFDGAPAWVSSDLPYSRFEDISSESPEQLGSLFLEAASYTTSPQPMWGTSTLVCSFMASFSWTKVLMRPNFFILTQTFFLMLFVCSSNFNNHPIQPQHI